MFSIDVTTVLSIVFL